MASHGKSIFPGIPGYDPDSLQKWSIQVVVSTTASATFVVGLRLASRRIQRQKLMLDDKLIIFSMLWYLLNFIFCFIFVKNGMGVHADLLEPDKFATLIKWLIACEILYSWNLVWSKFSMLLMYYRIFHVPSIKKISWVIGVFIIMWVIASTFLMAFICVPLRKLWQPEIEGYCLSQLRTWTASSVASILTDVLILILPFPQIWKLQLRVGEKIGLSIAFGLGFFVVFASSYRIKVLYYHNIADASYTLAPPIAWTSIELSAGIISCCFPTLLPVVFWCARLVGLKPAQPRRGPVSPQTAGRASGNVSNFKTAQETVKYSGSGSSEDGSRKHDINPFYRLSDDLDSASTASHPVDDDDSFGWQPSVETYIMRGTVAKNDKDLPLNGIVVQNDVTTTTIQR